MTQLDHDPESKTLRHRFMSTSIEARTRESGFRQLPVRRSSGVLLWVDYEHQPTYAEEEHIRCLSLNAHRAAPARNSHGVTEKPDGRRSIRGFGEQESGHNIQKMLLIQLCVLPRRGNSMVSRFEHGFVPTRDDPRQDILSVRLDKGKRELMFILFEGGRKNNLQSPVFTMISKILPPPL